MVALFLMSALGVSFCVLVYYDLFVNRTPTKKVSKNKYTALDGDSTKIEEKTIFMMDSTLDDHLNSRQACAVESAARVNPDWKIIVLLNGPPKATNEKSNKTILHLTSMRNVHFFTLDVDEFAKGTPMENFHKKRSQRRTMDPVVNNEDIMKMLILNKYGGLVINFDMIVTKSFSSLANNFVTKSNNFDLIHGIIRMARFGVGKLFTNLALREISKSSDPVEWAIHGSKLIQNILKKVCNTTEPVMWSAATCQGIEILDEKSIRQIKNWPDINAESDSEIEKSGVHVYHLWRLGRQTVEIRPKSLFASLAQQFCPDMYSLHGYEFVI